MRKFYLIIAIAIISLVSCNDSETKNDKDTTKNKVDTSDLKKNTENTETKKADFAKFEQYANIKTKDELTEKFKSEYLKNSVEAYAEGTIEFHVTYLKNPENGQVVKYVWSNEDNKTLSWIEASYNIYDENWEVTGTQVIETEGGLKLGMTLAELREWNGEDFEFSGFDWDYGGGIFTKEGSKISESGVNISLDYDDPNIGSFAVGDIELNADDERLKGAKIFIGNLTYHPKN